MDLSYSLAYGAQCTCPEMIRGDFCQYSTAKSIQNLPKIEYRQFDIDELTGIARLGSASANVHPSRVRADTHAIALGTRSQFVFCLTNPCENGGSCFVTNTATTKVRKIREGILIAEQRRSIHSRASVSVGRDMQVITVRTDTIKHRRMFNEWVASVRPIHVSTMGRVWK